MMSPAALEAFDEHGQLQDPQLQDRLAEMIAALLDQASLPLVA